MGSCKHLNLKPWPNGLASRRKFWTCVQLAFCLATHLRRLASTCDDLRWLWSTSNLQYITWIMKLLPSSSRPRPFWVMETSQYPHSYLSLCRLVGSPLQPLKNLNCAVYLKGPHLVFWLVESGQLMIYCYTTGVCKGRWSCRSVQCTWKEYKRIQRAGLIE